MKNHPVLVASILASFVVLTSGDTESIFDQVQVDITNRLGSGKNLTIHCRSKDDDLGEEVVENGGVYAWSFKTNAWGTTLFYCDLNWEGMSGFSFDAYSFRRDFVRCKSSCSWLVAKEGVYQRNEISGFWEFMYFWP